MVDSTVGRDAVHRLPRPVTTNDMLLAAILEELCVIRSRLEPAEVTVPDDEVELREPAAVRCETCGQTFKSKAGLARHRQAKH